MKIAFVTHDYNRHGGHARYTAELASRFAINHEVHVYANKWEEDNSKVIFHKVPAIRWSAFLTVVSFIFPATLMMRKKNFDVIHSQGLCGLNHTITTTHFIQEKWLNEFDKRKIPKKFGSFLWKLIVVPLEKLALGKRCSKTVIAISKSVKNDLIDLYKVDDKAIKLIYHGVDLEKFNPQNKILHRKVLRKKLGLNESDLVGLYIGNLQKGAHIAIKAISRMPNTHLVIVTGSDNSTEVNLAKNLGISERIHWVPFSKEIEIWFAMADFFVFPTLYEPFGMVISEAMASGLPVITNKQAGASELIVHGESGLLLENPWSVKEVYNLIKILHEDRENRIKIGEKAREAVSKYTWDFCAEKTMEIYMETINGFQVIE
jgi:UDP-glucose:(heptosyl)LPS alpha-1,3-glucosyltransferase